VRRDHAVDARDGAERERLERQRGEPRAEERAILDLELRGVELERADIAPLSVKLVLREGRRRDAAVDHFVERLERQAEVEARRLSRWR
jgi:hypothetical protein